ncbi:uncharacterized protein LOC110854595 [Folsomia candida]|uniref:uncharacterized protein LOC110854595 n=1 Tax=Folsomia candida TaxID=158441 RepID=UPI000B8F5981|nr:uncharacterized protein LOC110854595 [Folsomia candida]
MNTSTSCPDLPLQSGCPSHWNRDFILFYSVHIFALVTSTISFLACVTVILNVIRNKLCESRKNVVDRFPLYIAVNDALFCTMHGIDQLILLVTEVYPAKWVVFVLGSSTMFLYWYQQVMYASIAIYTYMDVSCRKQISTGRLDWKLHTISASLAGVAVTILYFLDGIGISRFWMGGHESNPTTGIYFILGSLLFTTTQAICTISAYSAIRRIVLNYKNGLEIGQVSNSYHDTAAQCLLTFVKIGVILYLPAALLFWMIALDNVLGERLKQVEPFYDFGIFLMVLVYNAGGFVNTVGYFSNQRIKRDRRRESELAKLNA